MKTFSGLLPEICSLENLYLAARKARKRKTRHEDVERFELHRERFLRELADQLAEGRWKPSAYRQFVIHDPKTRTISAAPYRDRVVHHALCNVIGPILERRFLADSFSCQKGKGTEAGRERCRRYTNRFRFALKCDIQRYFESIDHEILLAKLGRIIRCRGTMDLCRRIVASHWEGGPPTAYFAGDDLLAAMRPRGLPIGNLTSQLLANFYLDEMDHCIKEVWRVPGYARYTDDFILWADDRDFLWRCRILLDPLLEVVRLRLHSRKTRLMPCRIGVPFLGFRFHVGVAPRLQGCCKRRFERRMRRAMASRRAGTLSSRAVVESARGWKAFADYGNVQGLYLQYRNRGFGCTGAGIGAVRGVARGVVEQQQSRQPALREPQRQQ